MQKAYVAKLIAGIDSFDAATFAEFLTEDVHFRFGNAPALEGREAVQEAVAEFFGMIRSIRHEAVRTMLCDDVIIAEMECAYVDRWQRELVVPVCNLMTMRGELISDYRIFIDNSALFIPPAQPS